MDDSRRPTVDVDGDALDGEALRAYGPPPPPPDLVDRVMRAVAEEGRAEERGPRAPSRPRGWLPWAAAAALVAAGGAAWLLWPRPGGDETLRGEVVSEGPRTVALGGRAEAALEAGAALEYAVEPGGRTRVEQRAGEVRYRVRSGAPFVVVTPAGRVSVVGTEFRVEVSTMGASRLEKGLAGVGALATVTVAVYAGSVLLENDHGQVALAAGDVATAEAGSAPRRVGAPDDPAPAEAISAPRVTRFDTAEARTALVRAIERARARRADETSETGGGEPTAPASSGDEAPPSEEDHTRDREYIRSAMREIVPLLGECYESSLEATPGLGGRVVVRFHFVWEEDVGGVVTESEVDLDEEEGWDEEFRECIAETVMSLRLPEPTSSNETDVSYPLVFRPSDEASDGETTE